MQLNRSCHFNQQLCELGTIVSTLILQKQTLRLREGKYVAQVSKEQSQT